VLVEERLLFLVQHRGGVGGFVVLFEEIIILLFEVDVIEAVGEINSIRDEFDTFSKFIEIIDGIFKSNIFKAEGMHVGIFGLEMM
jgi:hypothetical protein